ncbi:MAG TPA: tyrosine--tRNA ligase [Clostridiales bacterium]|nr:tyrosine--tRNA ligase [Clostridiales bacterium]
MTDTNLYNELKERGLLYQCSDEQALKQKLESGEPIVVYEGSDPTANSLHIGHCVPYCVLRRFQKAGHKVILLMGGATACVGDPSGRTELRKMLTYDEINKNVESIKKTLKVFLDFDGDNPAEIVNNADWFSKLTYIDFMRDYGVHFNVNKMMATEIYDNRLKEGGLTFFEMGYMPMQAYDFVHLNRTKGCTLQYGGADQWGNIVAGVELQRKLNFQNGTNVELIGATNPLLLTPEGKKMGKTEKGAIWIDKDKISAYDFYQGVYQTPDACVELMFALFTDLPMDEIRNLIKEDIVKAKEVLSFEMTKFIRGEQDAIEAREATHALFKGGANLDNVPTYILPKSDLNTKQIVDIVTEGKLCASKSESRRMIEGGGITLNDQKVTDFRRTITESDLVDNYVILRKGKKNYLKVVFE